MQLTNINQNAIFNLSNDQWTGLNRWIGDIITSGNNLHQQYPAQFPPSFPEVVTCSQQWTSTTFENISQIITNMHQYAADAITNFSSIQASFNKLAPGSSVPSSLQQETVDYINGLIGKTNALCGEFQPIMNDYDNLVDNFIKIDNQWNANPEDYFEFCGFIMFCDYLPIPPGSSAQDIRTFLSDFLNQFINIFQTCEGGWLALKNDLSAAALSPINVNNAFLASLDLGICINDWQNLQNNASGFAQIVTEAHALWKNPDVQSPWETNG